MSVIIIWKAGQFHPNYQQNASRHVDLDITQTHLDIIPRIKGLTYRGVLFEYSQKVAPLCWLTGPVKSLLREGFKKKKN